MSSSDGVPRRASSFAIRSRAPSFSNQLTKLDTRNLRTPAEDEPIALSRAPTPPPTHDTAWSRGCGSIRKTASRAASTAKTRLSRGISATRSTISRRLSLSRAGSRSGAGPVMQNAGTQTDLDDMGRPITTWDGRSSASDEVLRRALTLSRSNTNPIQLIHTSSSGSHSGNGGGGGGDGNGRGGPNESTLSRQGSIQSGSVSRITRGFSTSPTLLRGHKRNNTLAGPPPTTWRKKRQTPSISGGSSRGGPPGQTGYSPEEASASTSSPSQGSLKSIPYMQKQNMASMRYPPWYQQERRSRGDHTNSSSSGEARHFRSQLNQTDPTEPTGDRDASDADADERHGGDLPRDIQTVGSPFSLSGHYEIQSEFPIIRKPTVRDEYGDTSHFIQTVDVGMAWRHSRESGFWKERSRREEERDRIEKISRTALRTLSYDRGSMYSAHDRGDRDRHLRDHEYEYAPASKSAYPWKYSHGHERRREREREDNRGLGITSTHDRSRSKATSRVRIPDRSRARYKPHVQEYSSSDSSSGSIRRVQMDGGTQTRGDGSDDDYVGRRGPTLVYDPDRPPSVIPIFGRDSVTEHRSETEVFQYLDSDQGSTRDLRDSYRRSFRQGDELSFNQVAKPPIPMRSPERERQAYRHRAGSLGSGRYITSAPGPSPSGSGSYWSMKNQFHDRWAAEEDDETAVGQRLSTLIEKDSGSRSRSGGEGRYTGKGKGVRRRRGSGEEQEDEEGFEEEDRLDEVAEGNEGIVGDGKPEDAGDEGSDAASAGQREDPEVSATSGDEDGTGVFDVAAADDIETKPDDNDDMEGEPDIDRPEACDANEMKDPSDAEARAARDSQLTEESSLFNSRPGSERCSYDAEVLVAEGVGPGFPGPKASFIVPVDKRGGRRRRRSWSSASDNGGHTADD